MKKSIYAILAIAALVCACNTKEEYTPEEATEGIPFVATVQSEAYTRAVAESGGDITVNFAESETIALVYEVSSTPYKTDATITSVDGSGKATITATLQTGVTDGTAVTLIYPASAADGTTGNVLASALSAQDGTLSAARDVRKGTGTIKVDGTASLASGATLEAQYAICKFEVEDVDGSNSVYVSSFVVKDASDNVITTVTPGSATSTLYVALPATSGLIWFEAVASDKPYVAKGTASLTAGNFYTPTVRMATIFNVIGQNGKFYKDKADAVAASTTAAAIIAYVGNGTAESGYSHGLAIAMKNALNGTYSTMRWRESGSGVDNAGQYVATYYALGAQESGLTISSTKNNSTYPAFQAAIANSIALVDGISKSAPSGTSGWFLASAYQWNQIIKSMAGSATDLSETTNNNLKKDAFNSYLSAAGIDYSAMNETYYWTSTEYDASYCWRYEPGSGSLYWSGKTVYQAVRSTLAF